MTARQAAGALALFAAIPLPGAAAEGAAGPNYSSHDAAFFARLVTGRAWILERPRAGARAGRGAASGFHYAADGTFRGCVFAGGAWRAVTGFWTIAVSRRHRAAHARRLAGPGPGAEPRGGTPIFYEPDSGRLHTEARAGGRWSVSSRGWVQESWPRALTAACPGLGVPGGLPLNSAQVSPGIDRLGAQDPAAALRNVPGSERRPPGRQGRAAARGGPAVTAAELAAFLVRNDGRILETPSGGRLVPVLGRDRDEVWRLGPGNAVAASGRLAAARRGDVIAIRWTGGTAPARYRIGDPVPLWPTDRRHPAMAAMDKAAADGRAVALPADGGPDAVFRFSGDGRVSAAGLGRAGAAGSWRWAGGRLVVRLDGKPAARSWPWRLFAARVEAAATSDRGASR